MDSFLANGKFPACGIALLGCCTFPIVSRGTVSVLKAFAGRFSPFFHYTYTYIRMIRIFEFTAVFRTANVCS